MKKVTTVLAEAGNGSLSLQLLVFTQRAYCVYNLFFWRAKVRTLQCPSGFVMLMFISIPDTLNKPSFSI